MLPVYENDEDADPGINQGWWIAEIFHQNTLEQIAKDKHCRSMVGNTRRMA